LGEQGRVTFFIVPVATLTTVIKAPFSLRLRSVSEREGEKGEKESLKEKTQGWKK
jgi:cytidylate kinase